jgi:hypothetical protein
MLYSYYAVLVLCCTHTMLYSYSYYAVLILYCTHTMLYSYYAVLILVLILYCTHTVLYSYYAVLILYCTHISIGGDWSLERLGALYFENTNSLNIEGTTPLPPTLSSPSLTTLIPSHTQHTHPTQHQLAEYRRLQVLEA